MGAALAAGCAGTGQEGGRAWAHTGLAQGGQDSDAYVRVQLVLPVKGEHRLDFPSGWLDYRLHLTLTREDTVTWLERNPTAALNLVDQLLLLMPLSGVAEAQEMGPFQDAIAQVLADAIAGTEGSSTEAFAAVSLEVVAANEAIPGVM